jgi:hypothetical protein
MACSSTANVALPELPGKPGNVLTDPVKVRVQHDQTPIPRTVVALSGCHDHFLSAADDAVDGLIRAR